MVKYKFNPNKKFYKRDKSRSIITQTRWTGSSPNLFPTFNLDKCVEMINYDPVARGALNHFIAKCMEGDISYINRDTFKYDWATEQSLAKKYNFRTEVLRKIFLQLKLFNNAFIELVQGVVDTDFGKTKALNVLNSQYVEPGTEANGDAIGYTWKIPNPNGGGKPTWTSDEIVWIKYGDHSNGMASIDMQALWENLLLKSYINRYVSWLWKTGQYRVMYGFDAPQRVVDDFIAYLKNTESDYQAPLLFGGEFKTQMIRDIRENESIVNLQAQLDYRTAILMRVNPVALGLPDTSGRSNADVQVNSFSTDVTDMKKVVEDYINNKLFPKINKGKTLIRFGPADRFSEKQAWEVVQIMKSVMATDEVCKEYLEDRGLFYEAKLFEPKVDTELPNETKSFDENGNPLNPREKDMQASRIGNGEGEGNQKQEEVTTREDQIRKVSE